MSRRASGLALSTAIPDHGVTPPPPATTKRLSPGHVWGCLLLSRHRLGINLALCLRGMRRD